MICSSNVLFRLFARPFYKALFAFSTSFCLLFLVFDKAFCWGPSAPSPPTGSASFGKPLCTTTLRSELEPEEPGERGEPGAELAG